MFGFLKKLFGSEPTPAATPAVEAKVEAVNAAPYKVEAPVAPVVEKTSKPAPKAPAKAKAPKAKAPAKKAGGPKPKAKGKPKAAKPAAK